jgi:sulfur carrier protein
MRVVVNGEERELVAGATLGDVLEELGLGDRRGIAIAVDADVVPRGQWDTAVLSDGAQVEVLTAVQGG